jgi:hypothetical protein
MLQHRLLRVLRTRRIESSGRRQQRRHERLVNVDRNGERAPGDHRRPVGRATAAATSRARTAYEADAAAGLATKSIREVGGAGSASMAPRIRRRTRLRTTAPPTALEVTIPTRTAPSDNGAAVKTENAVNVLTRPLRRRNAISPARRRRPKRLNRALNRQAVTAFFATGRKDLAAVLRAHPFHEPMDAFAAAVVRLESTFHVCSELRKTDPNDRVAAGCE